MMFFPVVGTLIGVLLAAAGAAGMSIGSPLVAGFGITLVWVLITGGFHLDGLADTFDGLSGGRADRARTLEIMRDSRIGTHGAVALVLLLFGKVVLTADLLQLAETGVIWVVPVAARAAVVPTVAWFRYARTEGLGLQMHRNATAETVMISQAVALAALWLAGIDHLPAFAATYAAVFAFSWWMSRKLSGLTGDTYGAAIEIGELAGLAGLLGFAQR
jgi:adenosylcobinamide-GDP ribazoletransferase